MLTIIIQTVLNGQSTSVRCTRYCKGLEGTLKDFLLEFRRGEYYMWVCALIE